MRFWKEVESMVEKQPIGHVGDQPEKTPSAEVCKVMPRGLRIGVTFVALKPEPTNQDIVNQQQLVETILSHKS